MSQLVDTSASPVVCITAAWDYAKRTQSSWRQLSEGPARGQPRNRRKSGFCKTNPISPSSSWTEALSTNAPPLRPVPRPRPNRHARHRRHRNRDAMESLVARLGRREAQQVLAVQLLARVRDGLLQSLLRGEGKVATAGRAREQLRVVGFAHAPQLDDSSDKIGTHRQRRGWLWVL